MYVLKVEAYLILQRTISNRKPYKHDNSLALKRAGVVFLWSRSLQIQVTISD